MNPPRASGSESAAIDPTDIISRVRDLRERRLLNGARSLLKTALREAPGEPLLNNELGIVETERERYIEAERAFVTGGLSTKLDSLPWWTRTLRELGRSADAIRLAEPALSAEPVDPRLHLAVGWCHYDLHEYDRAAACFSSALQSLPPKAPKLYGTEHGRENDLPRLSAQRGRRKARAHLAVWPFKPWFRAFRKAVEERVDQTKPALDSLNVLLHAEPELRASNTSKLSAFVWTMAQTSVLLEFVLIAIAMASALAYPGFVVLSQLLLTSRGGFSTGMSVLVVGGVVALSMFLVVASGIAVAVNSLRLFISIAPLYGIIAAMLASEKAHLPVAITYIAECAFAVAGAVLGLTLLTVLLISTLEQLGVKVLRRRSTRAALLLPLLQLYVWASESSPEQTPDSKSAVLAVERAALAARDHMRSHKKTGDVSTDAWVDQRADGMARAIRAVKTNLMTAGPETVSRLEQEVAAWIVSVVNGRWGEFPWADPSSGAIKRRRTAAIICCESSDAGDLARDGTRGTEGSWSTPHK
jgi:tetratricopeptide (TPR) repeat protein